MDIKPIGTPLPTLPGAAPGAPGGGSAPTGFGQVLRDSLVHVNKLQHEADAAIESLATGGTASLHDTMLAVQQADLTFRLMMQVRNKIVEAYQEVLRMSV